MRLLHSRICDGHEGVCRQTSQRHAGRDSQGTRRKLLPVRYLRRHQRRGGPALQRRTAAERGSIAMAENTYQWPDASKRKLIGKRMNRVDGPAKASGRAKYTYDLVRP